jgi:hypothetical protein
LILNWGTRAHAMTISPGKLGVTLTDAMERERIIIPRAVHKAPGDYPSGKEGDVLSRQAISACERRLQLFFERQPGRHRVQRVTNLWFWINSF